MPQQFQNYWDKNIDRWDGHDPYPIWPDELTREWDRQNKLSPLLQSLDNPLPKRPENPRSS